jgi:hypothetical protein
VTEQKFDLQQSKEVVEEQHKQYNKLLKMINNKKAREALSLEATKVKL